jgi:hemoglobin
MSKTSHTDAHFHRGGFADTSRPGAGVLEALGDRPGIERLVDVFYDRIAADPELEPVFGAHVDHGRGRLVAFFMEWLGGDPEYSRGMSGGQQRAHYKVAISRRSAGLWLEHFDAAMAERDVPAPLAKSLMKVLGPLARQMVNIEGEDRARFDACGNLSYLRGCAQGVLVPPRLYAARRCGSVPGPDWGLTHIDAEGPLPCANHTSTQSPTPAIFWFRPSLLTRRVCVDAFVCRTA